MSSINLHEPLNSLKKTSASTRSSPHFLGCGCTNVETIKHNLLQAAETISQLRTENSKLQNTIKESNIDKFDSLVLECKYLRNQLAYSKNKVLKNTFLRQRIEELKVQSSEKDKALEFQEKKLKEIKDSVKYHLQEVKHLVESNFCLKHKLEKAMNLRKNCGIEKISPEFNEFYSFLKQFRDSSIYAAIKGSLGSKSHIVKMLQEHKCTKIIKILIQIVQYVLKFVDLDKESCKSVVIEKKIGKQNSSISDKLTSKIIENGKNPLQKEPGKKEKHTHQHTYTKIKPLSKIELESSHEINTSESHYSRNLHPDFNSIYLMKNNKKEWNKTAPLRKLSEEPSQSLKKSSITINDLEHKGTKHQNFSKNEEFKENMENLEKHALIQLTVSTIKGANTEDNSEELEAEDHKESEDKSHHNGMSSEVKPNQQFLEGKSNKIQDLFEARRRNYKAQRLNNIEPCYPLEKLPDNDIIISSQESSISSKELIDSMELMQLDEKNKLRKTRTTDPEKFPFLSSQVESELVSLNSSLGSSNNEEGNMPHRSRWNFSQLPNLRIPPTLEITDKPEERTSKQCQVRQKSPTNSGESHTNRFREYIRPMMKEEKNWESVDAFFRSQSK